jgi:hypothetical protein
VQVALQRGERNEEVAEHPRPLTALPGEEERNLADRRGSRWRGARCRDVGRQEDACPRVGLAGPQAVEACREVVEVVGDDRRAHWSTGAL